MPILTPDQLLAKYNIGNDPEKKIIKVGAADLVAPPTTAVYSDTQRGHKSFTDRGIYVDPRDPGRAFDLRSQSQSGLDKFANSLVGGLTGALGVALEDVSYMTLQPLGEMFGMLEEWEQNMLAQWGEQLKEARRERFPIYKEDPENLWNGWEILGDLIENGLGFAIPGAGAAKAVQWGLRASRAARVKKYSELLKTIPDNFAKRAPRATGMLDDIAGTVIPGAWMNHGEGTMMGFETYHSLLDQGYSKEEAAQAADAVQFMNRALMATDMFQLHGIFKGSKRLRNTIQDPTQWRKNLRSAFTTLNADNPIMQSVVEASEEIIQGVMQREAENRVTQEFGTSNLFDRNFSKRLGEYIKDESLWYEGLLGFLSGGVQQVAMKEISNALDRGRFNKIQTQIDTLQSKLAVTTDAEEKAFLEGKIKDLVYEQATATQKGLFEAQQGLIEESSQFINKALQNTLTYSTLIENALREGRITDAEALQEAQFHALAYQNMAKGTLDSLERNLQDIIDENLTPEQISERGYGENYKAKVQEQLSLLRTLEKNYLDSQGYINQHEVFFNRSENIIQNKYLNALFKASEEILGGPIVDGKIAKEQGLRSVAEKIALAKGSKEYSLDKHLKNELKLGDIEDEAERKRVKAVKENIENSDAYKRWKEYQKQIKDVVDELELNRKQFEKITSPEYQLQRRKELEEYAKEKQDQKKAEIQKESFAEKQEERASKAGRTKVEEQVPKTTVQPETVEREEVSPKPEEAVKDAPKSPETVVEQPTEVQDNPDKDTVTTMEGSSIVTVPTPESIEEMKRAQEEHAEKEVQHINELGSNSNKITVNQRKYKKEGDKIVDVDNEYAIDEETGEVFETTRTTLDKSVDKGTEIIFRIDEESFIIDPVTRKRVKFKDLDTQDRENIDYYIPIAIYTKDGRKLGYVPSYYKGISASVKQLREHLYDKITSGENVTGEITYKHDGQLFRLKDKEVMNAAEAFPETLGITVIGLTGNRFGDQRGEVPPVLANSGTAHLILEDKNNRTVVLLPTNLTTEHVNTVANALEIFIQLSKGRELTSEVHKNLHKLLLKNGIDLAVPNDVRYFVGQYMNLFIPDRQFDLSAEEKKSSKYSSSLAKFIDFKLASGEANLANKPLIQILENGIAFAQGNAVNEFGKIGWSITRNSPDEMIDNAVWKEALLSMLTSSYNHVSVQHLGETVLDVRLSLDGKIESEKIPYDKLAKKGHVTRFKSTDIGTEESPQRVYTLNPVITYKLSDSSAKKDTPKSPVEVKTEATEQSTDVKADIEKINNLKKDFSTPASFKNYSIKFTEEINLSGTPTLGFQIENKNGGLVGFAYFWKDVDGKWYANNINIFKEENRRKGIMSFIYNKLIENNIPLKQSTEQTKDGVAFWESLKQTPTQSTSTQSNIEAKKAEKIISAGFESQETMFALEIKGDNRDFLLTWNRNSNKPTLWGEKQTDGTYKTTLEFPTNEQVQNLINKYVPVKLVQLINKWTEASKLPAGQVLDTQDKIAREIDAELKALEETTTQSTDIQAAKAKEAKNKLDELVNLDEFDDAIFSLPEGNAKQMVKNFRNDIVQKGFIDRYGNVKNYAGLMNYMNEFSDVLESRVRNSVNLPVEFKLARVVSFENNGTKALINKDPFHFVDLAEGLTTPETMRMLRNLPFILDEDFMRNHLEEYLRLTKAYRLNCR